jgi:putative two-component system response regulator
MQFKRRRLLVLLLVVSQMGCLAFGIVWASQWLSRSFERCIHQDVDSQGEVLVTELARKVEANRIATIEPGTRGWKQLQRLCERAKVPHDGFAAVMRADTGALVCHSQLQDDPSLLRRFPGQLMIVADNRVAPLVELTTQAAAGASDDSIVSGEVEVSGQLYSAACLALPDINAVLAVYQSEQRIQEGIAQLVNPLTQVGLIVSAAVTGVTALLTMFLLSRFESTLTTVNGSLEKEVERRTQSLLQSRNAVAIGLARLAESRSKDTSQHLDRLRKYVTILATEMAKHSNEIDYHYVANLAVASSLHDVGKVSVPDGVLLKQGLLTPAERRAMQLHTVLGAECIGAMQRQTGDDQFLELGRQVAAAHHEQWDGSGYPHGLQGRSIPLAARIVALADVYDALTSHRPYRQAVSHVEAREWIVAQYGAHFDPAVVEAFVAREQDFVKISQMCLDEPQPAASFPAAAGEPVDAPMPADSAV